MADRRRQSDEFEQSRLELFRSHGFDGTTQWLTDQAGRRTAAVAGGTGERTTLLLHGVLSQAGEWALVAGRLTGRIVIPDWPGSGLTPSTPIREPGLRRFAERWLTSVVDALGVERVDIVGSSSGGYLGLVYALAHPGRVGRIVQVGSVPGLTRSVPMIFRLFATPVLGRLILSQQPKDAEANRRKVFANLVAQPERIGVDMLEADLLAMALPNSVASGVDFSRALVSPLTGVRNNLLIDEDLASLERPGLYLWGSKDNFVDPDHVRPIIERAPRARLEIVEGAGHLLTLEAPDRVATSITAFLDAPR
jgi:pimeloyl-ACP methyl ester carboxylesterase